jgi:hypothetical protein
MRIGESGCWGTWGMPPEDFLRANLDVVLQFLVGFRRDPDGVTLIIQHLTLPDAMRNRPPVTTSLFLTLDQADELSSQLAQNRHQARSDRRPDA